MYERERALIDSEKTFKALKRRVRPYFNRSATIKRFKQRFKETKSTRTRNVLITKCFATTGRVAAAILTRRNAPSLSHSTADVRTSYKHSRSLLQRR